MHSNIGAPKCIKQILTDLKGEIHSNEIMVVGDFPGGTVVKNPPANGVDTGSSHGPGRSHMPRSN